MKDYFHALNLQIYNFTTHEKKYAPRALVGKEKETISRYSFWLKHASQTPLLYFAVHDVLVGSGSSIIFEKLNLVALFVLKLLEIG